MLRYVFMFIPSTYAFLLFIQSHDIKPIIVVLFEESTDEECKNILDCFLFQNNVDFGLRFFFVGFVLNTKQMSSPHP